MLTHKYFQRLGIPRCRQNDIIQKNRANFPVDPAISLMPLGQ